MKRVLVCLLLCLPLLAKDDTAQRRAALVRLHDDLRATDQTKLTDEDRQALDNALETLGSVTARGRRDTKQDRARVNTAIQSVEQLAASDALPAADRAALRRDLKELQAATDVPATRDRRRLRDAIQPDSDDAPAYPAPSPASASDDNSTHGGWRRVPAQQP